MKWVNWCDWLKAERSGIGWWWLIGEFAFAVMGAAAPMAPPKGSEHQQTPPTTAEWMKWNNSTWMAVNQFIWLMEWIELVSLNGGALRPRSSAANQSINSLLKKEEKWKLIWIDCGASSGPEANNPKRKTNKFISLFVEWNGNKKYYNSNYSENIFSI